MRHDQTGRNDRVEIPVVFFTAVSIFPAIQKELVERILRLAGMPLFVKNNIILYERYHNRKIALEGNKNEYLFSQIQMILEERNGRISREELASVLNYDAHYLNGRKNCGWTRQADP